LKIQKDKLLHFIAGLFVTIVTWVVIQNPFVALLTGLLAGVAKELIWDIALKRGTGEFLDFLATAIGSGVAFMPLYWFFSTAGK